MAPEAVDFAVKVPLVTVTQQKICCPYCGASGGGSQRMYGQKSDAVRYYECLRCVLPDGTGDRTRYLVEVVR